MKTSRGRGSGFSRRVEVLFNRFWQLLQDGLCLLIHLSRKKQDVSVESDGNFGSPACGSYRHELHVLEQFLYEAAGGEAEHAVGQQVGHLGVQADVVKRVRKLLLDPARGEEVTPLCCNQHQRPTKQERLTSAAPSRDLWFPQRS